MVQLEKNKLIIKETPEYKELQKINNKVFKEMFENELDSALTSLEEDVLDNKFEDLEKRVRAIRREFKDVNNLFFELQEWLLSQHKPMISSMDELKKQHSIDIIEVNKKIANIGSEISIENRENKSFITQRLESATKEQQSFKDELKKIEKEINIQISSLSQNLSDKITTEHKNTSDNTLSIVKEKNEEIEQRILTIEDSIKNNFEILQQEDGLTQLTNYKKDNDLQISSLKKAIVWLMGINIVLAISILAVLIIVLF